MKRRKDIVERLDENFYDIRDAVEFFFPDTSTGNIIYDWYLSGLIPTDLFERGLKEWER